MTAKDYLSQAYRLDQRINSKLEQVCSLRTLATKATSTISDTPPSGSRNVKTMESIVVKIVDLENELNEENILPKAFDPRVAPAVADAVAQAARESGVARV